MNRHIVLAELPTNTEKSIEISVGYTTGGMNYFSGNEEPRGYELYIQPITRDGEWTTRGILDGTRVHLKSANRFSAKTLRQVAENVRSEYRDIFRHALAHVLGDKYTVDSAVLEELGL